MKILRLSRFIIQAVRDAAGTIDSILVLIDRSEDDLLISEERWKLKIHSVCVMKKDNIMKYQKRVG